MRISSVFAASLVFLASLLSLAQSPQRHLTVIVEDPAGAPIPDAWVQVQHWAATDGKPRMVQDAATATDAQGRASLDVVSDECEVFASAHAFVPAVATFRADRGEISYSFKLSVRSGGGVEVEGSSRSQ